LWDLSLAAFGAVLDADFERIPGSGRMLEQMCYGRKLRILRRKSFLWCTFELLGLGSLIGGGPMTTKRGIDPTLRNRPIGRD